MPEMEVAKRTVVPVVSQARLAKQKTKRSGSPALEPVLEHCELYPSAKGGAKGLWACNINVTACEAGKKKTANLGRRILWKLRDRYVKLMNDTTTGAGYSGMASFHGCPGLEPSTNAWMTREEHNKKILLRALQLQLAHSAHSRQAS